MAFVLISFVGVVSYWAVVGAARLVCFANASAIGVSSSGVSSDKSVSLERRNTSNG